MSSTTTRIIGYDLARALAIMAMVLVNFCSIFDLTVFSPDWLETCVDFLYGRAATVFVMLAGLSLAILSNRFKRVSDRIVFKKLIMKRSLLLLGIGLILWHWWEADILHFYSLLLVMGAGIAFWPLQWLWFGVLSVLCISMPICAHLTVIYDLFDAIVFVEMQPAVIRLALDFVTSPFYSLFPWLGFFLIGMLLEQCGKASSGFYRRLFVSGVIVCIMVECLSSTMMTWAAERNIDIEGQWGFAFIRSETFPATPLFVISSGASSIALIGLCRWLTFRPSAVTRRLHLFVSFGQMSLTMYIAHIVWGFSYLALMKHKGENIGPTQMLFAVGAFYLSGFIFAAKWKEHFQRGPLETMLHHCHFRLFHTARERMGARRCLQSADSNSLAN